jgi:hypothetical protein
MDCGILSYVGNHGSSTRPEGLASWAPDWISPKTTAPLHHGKGTISQLLRNYHKDGIFGCYHAWVHEPRILILLGHIVDTVVRSSAPLSGLKISSHKRSEFSRFTQISEKKRIKEFCSDIYAAWKELFRDDDILPTLDNDGIFTPWITITMSGGVSDLEDFHRYLSSMMDGPDGDAGILHRGYYSNHCEAADFLILYFSPGFNKAIVDGRALARLSSGRLALVPACVRDGDVVVRLPTAAHSKVMYPYRPSFVVRPNEENRNSIPLSVHKETIISALEIMEKEDRSNLKSEHILKEISSDYVQTLGLDFNDDDSFVYCTFVGECLGIGRCPRWLPLLPMPIHLILTRIRLRFYLLPNCQRC